jgi:glycosyltransferase involved in cell wall biosynthesis
MKIKVCHIITKLELGGAQKNTLYTVSNLDKKKFDVFLLSGEGGILDDEVKKQSFKKYFLKNLVREISPLNDLIALIKIFKILREEKPYIIHTHSSKAGIIGRIAGFLSGVKIIIHTYHGFGFNEHQKYFVKKFYIFIEKLVSFITDHFIFVSYDNLETAKKYKIIRKDNYSIIRSGIKLSDFSKEKDYLFIEKYGFKKDGNIIISSVANLKPQKNPDDFIKVAEIVIKNLKNVIFFYCGGGEKLDYYRNIVKEKGLQNNLIFTGWIKDVREVYRSTDIFILTSLWEGLPRSVVEAIKSGCVVVSYKSDGVSDVIKNEINGFIVEKKDYQKMAEIIMKLIKEKDFFDKIKENAIKTDLLEFDIDFMVKKQEELYLKLIQI